MCHPERLRVVNAAMLAGAASIYTTCCHTPASGETLDPYCSHYHSCPYIAQFSELASTEVVEIRSAPGRGGTV